ncbi:MAG TPA: dipeptide epimerase [Firmicutes bacterium]|nr:dipeptide epimerase [Bacillota bacterium]
MRIEHVELYAVDLRLVTTHENALARYDTTRDVFVRLVTDEGLVGYGATAPKPYISGETQETVVAVLRALLIPAVQGLDPSCPAAIHRAMEAAVVGNPAAKAAIDLACYDVTGKALGVPAYQLLGGAYRLSQDAFDLIDLWSPERAAEEAGRLAAQGVTQIKVKVGKDLQGDLERVRAVRKAAPMATLKVDANQQWGGKRALQIIPRLEEIGVAVVEQPVPAYDVEGMARVRAGVSCAIMADESVKTDRDAWRLLSAGVVDALNVKISKVGGLWPAQRIVTLAQAAGIPCQAGCTLENSLVDAAAAHLFASQPNVIWNEIKAPQWIVDDVAHGLKVEGGLVYVPVQPGLGLEIDEERLARFRVG